MQKRVLRKKRDKFIAFYVSEAEKLAIADAASKSDMSISDYCRKALFSNLILQGDFQDVREDT